MQSPDALSWVLRRFWNTVSIQAQLIENTIITHFFLDLPFYFKGNLSYFKGNQGRWQHKIPTTQELEDHDHLRLDPTSVDPIPSKQTNTGTGKPMQTVQSAFIPTQNNQITRFPLNKLTAVSDQIKQQSAARGTSGSTRLGCSIRPFPGITNAAKYFLEITELISVNSTLSSNKSKM